MEQIKEINISEIKTNPNQPRKEFDKDKLKELADSISERGLINPIQVKKKGNGYELICGERRLKAHKLINKKTIKAIVKNYNSKSDEMVESLIENLHRDDLTSIEKENFITTLWETKKYNTKYELARAIGLKSCSINSNLSAKKMREKTFAAKSISTRIIEDVNPIKNIADKKKVFKQLEKGEINSEKVREVANIISKSPTDVKQAYFSNKISIQQASKISKITDGKLREKMIKAHKEIKKIDKSIEKNIEKQLPKTTNQLIKVKEVIENFRSNAIENQKTIQATIKSLINCMSYVNLMDGTQLKRLEHFQNLLEINLSNALEFSESLKEKITNKVL